MSGSSVRTEKLKEIQKLSDEPELKIKEAHSIRWLGLRDAVANVYYCYESVISTLSYFANDGNSVALGLYKYFSEYKTVLLVSLLLDVHNVIACLSCQLQSNDLVFCEMQPLLDSTLSKLECLDAKEGNCLKQVKSEIIIESKTESESPVVKYSGESLRKYSDKVLSEFTTVKSNYISALKKNMKHRFQKDDSEVFKDISTILDPSVVRSVSEKESEESLEAIAEFYGTDKEIKIVHGHLQDGELSEEVHEVKSLLNRDKFLQEWPSIKGMMLGSYKSLSLKSLCNRVIVVHNNFIPEFAKLCKIALCLCVTSVECERSFSFQNRMKNKSRCSLKSETLNKLITISMCERDVESFDVRTAIRIWHAKKRRVSRLVQDYKPRKKISSEERAH